MRKKSVIYFQSKISLFLLSISHRTKAIKKMEQISVSVVFQTFFPSWPKIEFFYTIKKTYLLVFSHLVVAATSDEGNFLRQNIPGAASATPATSEAVASEAAGGGNSS